jgi:hypothetical protein
MEVEVKELRFINLDMDGVTVDFDSHFFALHGRWPAEVGEENFWKVFDTKRDGFFRDCKPFPGLEAFLAAVMNLAEAKVYGVRTLTALPRRSTHPTATQEKQDWHTANINCHYPQIEMCTGPYAIDKQKWCKPGHILIDDKPLNIQQWEAKGGIGILHEPGDFESSLIRLRQFSNWPDSPAIRFP